MSVPKDESTATNDSNKQSNISPPLPPDSAIKSDDAQLSELLDDALQDFGRKKYTPGHLLKEASRLQAACPTCPAGRGDTTSVGDTSAVSDESIPPFPFDPDFTRQAAAEFHNMLKQLTDMQKLLNDQAQLGGGVSSEPDSGDIRTNIPEGGASGGMTISPEEAQFTAEMMANLNLMASKAQKIGQASSNDELWKAMSELHADETYANEFLPFMEGLMSSLLSKEMLHPSLKEICGKYPDWIEANKASLDAEQLDRYEKQLELMKEVCKEYENEKEADSPEVQQVRFQRIVGMLQEMQMMGQPPPELVGDLPPGWGFDQVTGLPKVTDQQEAANACSVM